MNVSEAFPKKECPGPSIEDVKARTSMVVLVGRNVALKKHGREHFGLCPFHNEKTPSFKVNEAKRSFHCFGCGAHGDAFDYLRRTQGMELHEALEHLAIEAGMIADREGRRRPTRQPIAPPDAHGDSPCQDNPNGALALDIWNKSQPAAGTPVEAYLRHRGINIPAPPSIRYNPSVKYTQSGLLLPCMVAAVQAPDRSITAIHRTYIRDDGQGKASVVKPKMMLGPIGGGAVRLAAAASELLICEGIETGLTVQEATSKPVWVCLSAGGLKSVVLPSEVETVIIAADADEAGEQAAQEAARRLIAEGRTVKIARPPRGMDFNDLAQLPENVAVITDQRRREKANG